MSRPAPRSASASSRPATLADWLRGRTDHELTTLLRRRPDLGLPAPGDFATLASRISVRSSLQRAVDGLNAWELRTLEALVLTASDNRVELADAAELLPAVDLQGVLDELRMRALVWGDGTRLHLVSGAADALGPYPAGLGRPAAILFRQVSDVVLAPVLRGFGLPPAMQPASSRAVLAELLPRINDLIAASDADERDVLDRLAAGPPAGLIRDAMVPADSEDSSPALRLVARGLLVPIDSRTVELPREVGLAVRGERPLSDVSTTPPPILALERTPAEADRAGTTAVLEVLRLVEALAEEWARHPAALLRGGGIGVRELRRTARRLDLSEPNAGLFVEVAVAAGLLTSTNGIDPAFLPTSEFDLWRRHEPAERWVPLAAAWLGMSRQPSLIGQRDDRDKVINALSPDAERGTIATLRRGVLNVLAGMAPGTRPRDAQAVLDRLTWESPRRASAQRALAEQLLLEADQLGVTAAGGLTGYGRALLAGSAKATEDALTIALPAPVSTFLVQPDLTVVVPGPPATDLASELDLVADLESSGGASVYRVTESTIRRALDAGRSGAEVAELFASRSTTPIPQALSYLIEDVGRRHGVLRTGVASSYLRCDDENLLNRVMSDRSAEGLGMRRLAPTVVICASPVAQVLDVLREAGYAPAAESPDGAVVTVAPDSPRAPIRHTSRLVRPRPAIDSDVHLAEVIRRIRSGDSLAEIARRVQPVGQQIPGVTSATTLGLLRDAIRGGRRIWLGYVDADGTGSQHTIVPISMAGGVLRGHEESTSRLQSYPLHRITAVSLLDDAS
jgi:Helicase conserved C-terminal domain